MRFLPRRLFWPLVVSIVLHASIGVVASLKKTSGPAPRIEVRLPSMPEMPADRLLKNTYRNTQGERASAATQSVSAHRMEHAEAQRQRLAAHVFYPPQAVEQGLEGEVRLLLRLDAKGRLLEARVASSSGHQLLDDAAVAAAYATGAFPGGDAEMILPVVFRLSE